MISHFIRYLCLFVIFQNATIRGLQINVFSNNQHLSMIISNADLANSNNFFIAITGRSCYNSDSFTITSSNTMTITTTASVNCIKLAAYNYTKLADGVVLYFNTSLTAASIFNLMIFGGDGVPKSQKDFTSLGASGPVTNLTRSSNFPSTPLSVSWAPPTLPYGIITQYIAFVNSSANPCLVWSTITCTDCGSLNTINTTGTSITPACINIASEGTFSTKSASISMTMTSPLIQPYMEYSVYVVPINTFGWGNATFTTVRTAQFNPSSPRQFTCVSVVFNQFGCSWMEPSVTNGPLTSYNFSCSNSTVIYSATLPSTQLSANVSDNVMPSTTYTCTIQACNSLYCSQFTTFSITLPPSTLPDFANIIAMANGMSRPSMGSTSTQIYITLPYSYVIENRLPIKNFTLSVVVSGNGALTPSMNSREKTYTDCDGGNKCPYVIILPYPVTSSRRKRDASNIVTSKWQNIDFTIGDGSTCSNERPCNGPLTPSTQYIIGFRACTIAACNIVIITKSTTNTIVISIVVPVVVVLLVVVLLSILVVYIVRYKKKLAKDDTLPETPALADPIPYDEIGEIPNEDFQSKDSKQFEGNEVTYNQYIRMSADYHNVIDLSSPGDYIMPSYKRPTHCTMHTTSQCCCTNYYIAAQGPIGSNTEGSCSTIGDFWRMIVENDVRVIINLTRCVENDQEEYARYWPGNVQQSETYHSGDHRICVTLEKFSAFKTFDERILSVTMEGKSLSIVQLDYTAWNNDEDFNQFYDRFVQVRQSEGPIVVHCSAGVGRTDTRVLVNDGYNKVDIYKTLLNLSQCRCGMVQCENHSIFVHEVVKSDEDQSDYGYLDLRNTHGSQRRSIRTEYEHSNESYE